MSDDKKISYRIPNVARKAPKKMVVHSDKSRRVDFIGSVILACIVGALIDRAFGTVPWGTLSFAVFGLLSGWAHWRRR